MKKFLAMLLALVIVLSLAACSGDSGSSSGSGSTDAPPASTGSGDSGSGSGTTDTPPAATKTGELTIGISVNSLSNIHNRHMFEGLTSEAEARGHKVVSTSANGDPSQQATDIENLVAAGCDVVVIENGDQFSLQNAVKEAAAAGTRIISYETGYFEGIDCMYQLNSIKVQADICMQLAAEVGFKGKVITTGHQDVFALRAGAYIHDAFLSEYEFESVAHVQTTFPGTTEVTYTGLDAALTANPDVVAIFTSQDLEAMGAIQALKEHDLYPQVKCVGVDGEVDVLNDIKNDGAVLCTAISDLDGANKSIVETCERLMAGETVPSFIEIPYDLVNKDNVDTFLAKAEADAAKYAE